jgi:hypothetical protein
MTPTCELCGKPVLIIEQEYRHNDEGYYHLVCLDAYYEESAQAAKAALERIRGILTVAHDTLSTTDQALERADESREQEK